MKFINKKIVLVVIILMVGITLFVISKPKDNIKLESVNLKSDKDNSMFAIMLEQEDGTYKEDESSTWPTSGYSYNTTKSGCIDANGNEIVESLNYNFETNNVVLKTKEASYCYLYFSFPRWCESGETAGECLLRNPTKSLNVANLEAGMYRYQGTDANNYVCFGTYDKNECVDNASIYMYRIIGINENKQLKLIKKEDADTEDGWYYDWYLDNFEDVTWPNSDTFNCLNGDCFLYNKNFVPDGWESKIATTTWKYGDTTSNGNYDGETMYAIENAWTDTEPAKIGLMYIHDYYYAYASGGTPGNSDNAKTAWIHLSLNDSDPYSHDEQTMSRYGMDDWDNSFMAWTIWYRDGSVLEENFIQDGVTIRPVFYLNIDTEITDGTGTIDDPFIID